MFISLKHNQETLSILVRDWSNYLGSVWSNNMITMILQLNFVSTVWWEMVRGSETIRVNIQTLHIIFNDLIETNFANNVTDFSFR